ncbi:opacity protein-like surface antigen [Legionella lansingensis]|uniref:Opacity protein-like surface antigen n=1 Tax=Legionella lansingensis TaxID=45067 RepID=A0A0W0VMV6_9GAMM|nr:outer membrane beta-barrel protein [Legionella lansingensis]KTD21407.1 opacity protein-like surface antigen [Legionella lansingensis]SNV51924.1 opacity protein-like surface antigen [Legionella lansingensis]
MKTYIKLGLAGLLTASSSAFSVSPPDGWYAGLFGELNYTPKIDFTITTSSFFAINGFFSTFGIVPPLTSGIGEIDYSTGGGGGGHIGYRYCGWRFEGELLFNYSPYDKVTIGGVTLTKNTNSSLIFPFSNLTIDGNTSLGAALFNVYYDFYDYDYDDVSFVPYVGLGIGYGYIQDKFELDFVSMGLTGATGITTTSNSTNIFTLKENTSTPVGQAIVGVSYLFNESFSAALDYRYVTTKKISNFNDRFTVHTLNLSFSYWFSDY